MKFLSGTNIKREFLDLDHIKILLFSLTLISFSAQAKLMLEPSTNIYSGSFSVSNRSGSLTGKTLNLNIGYLGPYFMAGISVEKGTFEYDSDVTTDKYTTFDGGGVGTFIGFHFFDRIKLWSTYLNSSLEPVKNNDTRYFGQHFSAGIGFRIIDGLILSYQNFSNQFTQFESDITGKTEGLDNNIKTSGNIINLSYLLAIE